MNTAAEDDPALIEARTAMRVPIVMLERQNTAPADSILLAHHDGMMKALSYLFDLGHRRVGLVTGNANVYAGRERLRGYREAHAARDIPVDPNLIRVRDFSGDAAFSETMALLDMTARPTAIIAGGIAMLEGTLRAIRAHGLRIPDDISLIGNADSELAQLATPPVTVVRWDYARLGTIAARMLLDRFAGTASPEPRRVLEPSEFVIRGSCAAPRS
jgi:LacI family transcriptional regulator